MASIDIKRSGSIESFMAPSNERIRDYSALNLASEKCHVIARVTYPSPSLSLVARSFSA